MPTCLCIHLYGLPADRLGAVATMARVLEDAGATRWNELAVAGPTPVPTRSRVPLGGGRAAVVEALRGQTLEHDDKMSVGAALPCWRRTAAGGERGSVAVTAEVFGEGYATRNHEDVRLGGDGQVTIWNVAPFRGPAMTREAPEPRIIDNLNDVRALVVALVRALGASSAKVFVDAGLYLPINAHLACYRDASAVLADVALLQQAWHAGLPGHRERPLGEYADEAVRAVLHEWRSQAETETLWRRLRRCIDRRPDRADVAWAIETATAAATREGDGCVVGEPYFLDGFVDGFFVELLEHAAPRPR